MVNRGSISQPYKKYAWKKQYASIDQAPPTVNIWYPILDTTEDVKFIMLCIRHDNTGVTAEDIEVRCTVDDHIMVASATALASGTLYFIKINYDADSLVCGTAIYLMAYYESLEAQSGKVEIRQTSDVGAGARLRAYLHYATLEAT